MTFAEITAAATTTAITTSRETVQIPKLLQHLNVCVCIYVWACVRHMHNNQQISALRGVNKATATRISKQALLVANTISAQNHTQVQQQQQKQLLALPSDK